MQQVVEHLYDAASAESRIKWELDASFDHGQMKHFKVTSLGKILIMDVHRDDASHPQTVERFTTNGFSRYVQGGVADGLRFANEARLQDEQLVTGLPLFVSRFYQARVLVSLIDARLTESDYEGERAYVITGQAKQFGFPINISMVIAQNDFLLLEEDFSFPNDASKKITKIKSTRGVSPSDGWPYSAIYKEFWTGSKMTVKEKFSINVTNELSAIGEELPELVFPDGTLVADDRSGKTFHTGPKKNILARRYS